MGVLVFRKVVSPGFAFVMALLGNLQVDGYPSSFRKFKDYYEILGIPKNASEEAIKRAYKDRAKEHHPDCHPDDSQDDQATHEEAFKAVGEAYKVLSNPESRKAYDELGDIARAGGGLDPGTRFGSRAKEWAGLKGRLYDLGVLHFFLHDDRASRPFQSYDDLLQNFQPLAFLYLGDLAKALTRGEVFEVTIEGGSYLYFPGGSVYFEAQQNDRKEWVFDALKPWIRLERRLSTSSGMRVTTSWLPALPQLRDIVANAIFYQRQTLRAEKISEEAIPDLHSRYYKPSSASASPLARRLIDLRYQDDRSLQKLLDLVIPHLDWIMLRGFLDFHFREALAAISFDERDLRKALSRLRVLMKENLEEPSTDQSLVAKAKRLRRGMNLLCVYEVLKAYQLRKDLRTRIIDGPSVTALKEMESQHHETLRQIEKKGGLYPSGASLAQDMDELAKTAGAAFARMGVLAATAMMKYVFSRKAARLANPTLVKGMMKDLIIFYDEARSRGYSFPEIGLLDQNSFTWSDDLGSGDRPVRSSYLDPLLAKLHEWAMADEDGGPGRMLFSSGLFPWPETLSNPPIELPEKVAPGVECKNDLLLFIK